MNRLAFVGIAACVAAAGALLFERFHRADEATPAAALGQSPPSAATAKRDAPATESSVASVSPTVSAKGAEPKQTLGMQLEVLTASAKNGNGQDAFLAYRLANECAAIPQREQVARSLPAEAKAIATRALDEVAQAKARCASVTARQIYDRTQNLRIAMQAGIRDASIAYYVDGPNGDVSELTSRPDDVAVKQWKAEAEENLKKLAMLGDKEALLLLSTAYQSGQAFAADSSKAYLYAFALAQISKEDGTGPSKSLVALLKSLEGKLSADQLAAAQRDGTSLARQCCKRNG